MNECTPQAALGMQGRHYKKVKFSALLIGVILICVALTGIVPQLYLSLLTVVVLGCLFFFKELYCIYAVMLFFYIWMGMLFGISVYRLFTFLFLVKFIWETKTIRVATGRFITFLLFVVYCGVVILPIGISRSVFAVLDIACILLLVNKYLSTEENLKAFFTLYVVCALLSYFTGSRMDAGVQEMYIDGEIVEMVRNAATFEDPNYMTFFFTAAIFSMVTLKLFSPKVRLVLIIALYAMILSSLSITAIIANVVLWATYLLTAKKLGIKQVVALLLVVGVLLGIYSYGLKHPEHPVFGMLSLRISQKMGAAEAGDYVDATSGRTQLQKEHWKYFLEQPLHKQIFGMNAASTLKTNLGGITGAAHNEYLDWLLNVGILGAIILLVYFLASLWKHYKTYTRTGSPYSLCVLFLKLMWGMYAFTLTLYGDFRFALFFYL